MTDIYSEGQRFLKLMKRYVVEYVNLHRPEIIPELMTPDYFLKFGSVEFSGRDVTYRPMAEALFAQMPQIAITVHEVIANGPRFAMRYTEHCRDPDGLEIAWGGIGLYQWDGERLTRNGTEQDQAARDTQIASRKPGRVEPPAVSPWDTSIEAPDPAAESIVRTWLESGAVAAEPGVLIDDAWASNVVPPLIKQHGIELLDLFSAGSMVAFHALQHGSFLPNSAAGKVNAGRQVQLYIAGLVRTAGGRVVRGTVMRNKNELAATLQQAQS